MAKAELYTNTRVYGLERTTEELWYKCSNQGGDKQAAAERRHLDWDRQMGWCCTRLIAVAK